MQIKRISNINFGILTNKNVTCYTPKSYIETLKGQYKDYRFIVRHDYINNIHCSTLISLYKGLDWIKSKLKYYENGKQSKILRSVKNDKMV